MGKVLIGAHTSAAGGAPNALLNGAKIGATTIQLFTSNQKQWTGRKIGKEEIALWKETLEETGIKDVMSHDSYLINLGSNKPDLLKKSRKAFLEEIHRCQKLDIPYLNFHPGVATSATEEECIETIIDSLLSMKEALQKGSTMLLLETTAGQGTSVGHKFEHLGAILSEVKKEIPIGVCIDTCHIFAAGYDIRTKKDWEQTLGFFDKAIGLSHLKAFHLNDSLKEKGSRVDRHANLGKGKIGWASFRYLMENFSQPKYLETPHGDKYWAQEIETLKSYAKKKS